MNKVKQPFITIENLNLRLVSDDGTEEIVRTVSAYGFTSRLYMWSTFLIFFLAGAIACKLVF